MLTIKENTKKIKKLKSLYTSFLHKQESGFSHTNTISPHYPFTSEKTATKPQTHKIQSIKNIVPLTSSIHRQITLSKNLLIWKKIQFFIFLLIFSAVMLCCSQTSYTPPSQQTLDQNMESLLDDNASCAVPKSAQIVHLPQVHKYPEPLRDGLPERVLNFFHDIASNSQFLIAHIISENPSHIVFNEGSRLVITENNKDSLMYTIFTENGYERSLTFQDVAGVFNHRLPSSYNSLNREQKHLLLELGAASIALSLDHIQVIHRTHNPSEAKLLGRILTKMWNSQDELASEFHDLYERISTAEENNDRQELIKLQREAKELSKRRMSLKERSDQLILDKREEILSREVHFFLENNPSRKVFIIYGAAHDLSDEFRNDHFYTLPHRCTMPQSFLKSSSYARYLTSWADRIYNDNDVLFADHIQSMIMLYQKSYDILTDVIEEHIQKGGSKRAPSLSWNQGLNRYLTYSELETIAEVIYVQKTGWEDILQPDRPITYVVDRQRFKNYLISR